MAIDLSLAPYYDDFNDDKGFHKLLFRPGRAVQARELTQLQTILQNQMARFGQNIFLEGTVVIPGGVTIDTNYEYVKLSAGVLANLQVGATLQGSSGLTAVLLQAVAADGSDPDTIYVRYTGGGSGNGGRFGAGETITFQNPAVVDGGNAVTGSVTAAVSAPSGVGTKVNLDKGIYFIKGYFVVATSQSLIVEKYGIPSGTVKLGLISSEEIVDSAADSSLLSNAIGSSNANAPGADRYKLALTLALEADVDASTQDYFTIATIKNAVIVEALTRTQYGLLGDELARRTYDESGNYTVNPFIVRVEPSSTSGKLNFVADPGRAYVRGYEVNKTTSTTIEGNKAEVTGERNSSRTATPLGNYVRAEAPNGSDNTGLPNIGTFAQVNLRNSSDTVVGTARVRAVEKESASVYRYYLFDVSMSSGSFSAVRDLQATGFEANLVDASGTELTTDSAVLHDTGTNALLFYHPQDRVKQLSDVSIRVQRYVTFTTDGSGSVTVDSGSSDEKWANSSDWILVKDSDGSVDATGSIGTVGTDEVTITGLDASAGYKMIAYLDKDAPVQRPKTKTDVVDEVITPVGNVVTLADGGTAAHDIYQLVSVKDVGAGDADITSRYVLDNGQRDNYYGIGKLTLKATAVAPTGNVKVSFSYFAHAAGDYFAVDSYDNLVAAGSYSDIPTYVRPDGSSIFLADVYDFRPVINDAGTGYTGAGAVVQDLPQINETIQADVEYHLPRIDILYIASDGEFGFASGIPSLNPVPPQTPANAMAIYHILFNAGTFDETDVTMAFVDNKRYTMRDIGRIEERVSRVEEWSTLSLLESETATLDVLDEDGNNRFKSGFFVDNFEDHLFADFNNAAYRASIDPRVGEVRPTFQEDNIRMVYQSSPTDGSTSTNVVIKGDFLYMDYTESVEVSQLQASSAVNVNPYAVITGTGMITLSPESDEWRDINTDTRSVSQVDTERVVSPAQEQNFNNWEWNWGGFTEPEPTINTNTGGGGGGGGIDNTLGSGVRFRAR